MSLAKGPSGGYTAGAHRSLGRLHCVYLVSRPLIGDKRHTDNASLHVKPRVSALRCPHLWCTLLSHGHSDTEQVRAVSQTESRQESESDLIQSCTVAYLV